MKVQYYYNIGDIVHIQPYSIFNNPTPIEWNDDPYGYGNQYVPEQAFPFEQSIDLFAQYSPICINYYLTAYTSEGQLTASLVSYENRVGTRIEVADFPWIDGFAGWLDKYGNVVDVGSYIYLTSTVDLFMSCDFDYSLSFNANGGSGKMEPITSTKHVYIDCHTKQAQQEDAEVVLPSSTFQNPDVRFGAWQIDGQLYDPGQAIHLSKDQIAYAIWKNITRYTLNTQCLLVNEDFTFRYFMLKVNSTIGNGKKIRFSKVCFIDTGTGDEIQFPQDATSSTKNIANFDDQCGALNGIDGSTSTTVSINATKMPCAVIYDLQKPMLDVSKYSHMQIWTASNSSLVPHSNMNNFELYVSNNGEDWFLADSYSGPVNTGSRQISYESQDLFVSSIESDVWDDPIVDDFTLVGYAKGNGGCVDIGYVPTSNTKIVIEMKSDSQYTGSVYIGFYAGDDNKDFRYFCTDANATYFDISRKRYKWVGSPSATDFHTVICSKDGISIDGQSKGSGTGSIDEISNSSIYVFGIPGHEVNFMLKHLQIYELDQLKLDIKPAVDKASKSCLVDVLSKAKYYSVNGKDIYCSNDSGQQFCTVTFNANGGACSERSRQIRVGTAIGELPQAEKVDWFYVGWYTSASGGTQVTKDTVFSSSATIYARYVDVDTRTYVKYADGSDQYLYIVGEISSSHIPNRAEIELINIGASVTSLADYAFQECSKLTTVMIPNSVTIIGKAVFDRCRSITSIVIPNSVTSIGSYAFFSCNGLTSITIPNSVTSIGDTAFCNCISLMSVTIPNSVTSIELYAFSNCRGLTSLTIPGSVTSIGTCAFQNCGGLTSVTIPDSVTSIGHSAFANCSKLTHVTIGNNVVYIWGYAFSWCYGLTNVTIPDTIEVIQDRTFYHCDSIAHVTIVSNGGNAQNAKQLMIDTGVSPSIDWIIQSE